MHYIFAALSTALIVGLSLADQGHNHGDEFHHHAHYRYEPIPGGNNYTLTVTTGETTRLRCRFKELGGRQISWVRRRDWHILTSNNFVYIKDDRFRVERKPAKSEWTLVVENVQPSDNGTYQCQVTDGERVLSTFIQLIVLRPHAVIYGAREYTILPGNIFNITCSIIETRYPVNRVYWSFNEILLTSDSPREGLTLVTRRGEVTTTSYLVLKNVTSNDTGTYSCSANNAAKDSIDLFVGTEADKAAAISRKSSSSSSLAAADMLGCLLLLSCVRQLTRST